MSPGPDRPRRPLHRRPSSQILVACLVGLLLIVGLVAVGADEHVRTLLTWVERLGPLAPVVFVLLHALAVVLLVPGILFPLGAGFLFGAPLGALVSTAGKVLGATVAFTIARHLLRGRALEWLERHPRLRRLDRRLDREGWPTVLLVRLVPVIPFKFSNYVFGLTRFRLRSFVLGTTLGALPFSVINAWLGSVTRGLAELDPTSQPVTPEQWYIWIGGLAVALLSLLLLTRVAMRLLRESEQQRQKT